MALLFPCLLLQSRPSTACTTLKRNNSRTPLANPSRTRVGGWVGNLNTRSHATPDSRLSPSAIVCFHNTRTHFVCSSLRRLSMLLLPTSLPSTCLPALFPVVHALQMQSPENLSRARSKFRRTQSTTYLPVNLRLTPICSHSSQTPKYQVVRRQPSTLRSFTE